MADSHIICPEEGGKSTSREPLNTQEILVTDSQGNVVKVPAIDKHFMEIRQFVLYKPFDFLDDHEESTYDAAKEDWIQRMEYLQEDLHWLLKLPHHKFWSQVVYDNSLHQCLDSYLLHALRDFDLTCYLEADQLAVSQRIHKLTFFVFLRMSTYKESKHNYITPDAFGELIYDNYLFDIPKLMDLCALYGSKNSIILKKMVSNIFNTQPSYMDDLESVVPHLFVVLDLVKEQLNLDQNHDEAPAKLGECISLGISSVSVPALLDIIYYITDISRSISAFLDIYSQASHVFYKHGTVTRIAVFYDMVFPAIESELLVRENEETKSVVEQAKFKVRFAKTLLVKIFRNLITMCCVQPIIEAQCNNSGEENQQESTCFHLETYMEIFTEVVAHKHFIHDYNIMFPFEADIEMLSEIGLSFDPTRLDYIFNSIHQYSGSVVCNGGLSSTNELAEMSWKNYHHNTVKQHDVKDLQGLAATLTNVTLQTKNNGMELSNSSATDCKNYVQLDSLITSVLEVFPGLGQGFIEACLQYYSFDFEMVIDVLLRGDLPDCLSTLDRDLQRMPVPNKDEPSSLLTERRNVYDNDEFDIFNRPYVDMRKIHKGKKNKTPDTYQGLYDGSNEISALLKEISLSYEETHEGDNYHKELDLYEDEYDDTYDSNMVGLVEQQTEDSQSIRPFVTPRVLEQRKKSPDSPYIKDEDDEEESEEQLLNADEFIPNPAVLRERALQKRQAAVSRGGKQYNHRENSQGQNSVGRSQQGRHHKEKHKSQIANHNRKRQSDFKRSRGMGPLPPR